MFKSLPDRHFPPIHSFFYISRAILTGKNISDKLLEATLYPWFADFSYHWIAKQKLSENIDLPYLHGCYQTVTQAQYV
jgi:hypothetical protein